MKELKHVSNQTNKYRDSGMKQTSLGLKVIVDTQGREVGKRVAPQRAQKGEMISSLKERRVTLVGASSKSRKARN